MSRVSTGKCKTRMLTELSELDNGYLDVAQLSMQFGVSTGTILADFSLLKSWGFVDMFPNAVGGECEHCNKQGIRVTHHWADELGFHTKSLCWSCNARLGHIFKGNYPTWEEQVKALNKQLVGA